MKVAVHQVFQMSKNNQVLPTGMETLFRPKLNGIYREKLSIKIGKYGIIGLKAILASSSVQINLF